MTKLGDALREKFSSPSEAIRALGLDEALLQEPGDMSTNKDLAKKLLAHTARQTSVYALTKYLKPRLAMDAEIPVAEIFDGVTGGKFKDSKPTIATRIRALTKDKLAKDASLDDVEKVLDMLDGHEIDGGDESVSKEQHNAMAAAAAGHSNLGIPEKVGKEFVDADKTKTAKDVDLDGVRNALREKGLSDEDIEAIISMLPKDDAEEAAGLDADNDDDDDEAKRKREEEEKQRKREAKDKRMSKDKDTVTRGAMDEALKAHGETVAKNVRENERSIRTALATARDYVGELSPDLAFDSAADVYRKALDVLGVSGAKTLHQDALLPVLQAQQKIGAQPTRSRDTGIGMDSASVKSFNDRFPDAQRIRPV